MRWIRNFWTRVRREPAFAAIFVITLALGVGANAALFSALRGYFLAPLPYPHAGRLIAIGQAGRGDDAPGRISVAAYAYLLRNAKSISAGGLVSDRNRILRIDGGQAHTVRSGGVTGPWLKALGVAPYLGRTFDPQAWRRGGPNEVILSHRFWRDAMHGDQKVIGKTIAINAHPHVVIGVMPQGFYFGSRRVKFWTPHIIGPNARKLDQTFSTSNRLFVARLRPGVSLDAARKELNALAWRQVGKLSSDEQKHAHKTGYHIAVTTLRASLMGSAGAQLLLIELGAAVLLLLTAAILANLVTVRTLARRHEAALRITLGASRFDLWRSALAETLQIGRAHV